MDYERLTKTYRQTQVQRLDDALSGFRVGHRLRRTDASCPGTRISHSVPVDGLRWL